MKPVQVINVLFEIALLALILPACSLAAQNPDSAAISKLLSNVKAHAALADDDASALAAHARSNLESPAHSRRLNMMKEHVNNLIRDGNEMASLRSEGSPWQQEAIDRISALLPEMASHLTATINHLNENWKGTRFRPYRNLVLTNQVIIHKAHEIISDFVDYGEAKARAEALEREMQLPTSTAAGNPF